MKVKLLCTFSVMALAIAFAPFAQAQTAANGSANSAANSGAQSGSSSGAVVNQYSSGQLEYSGGFHQNVSSQVPLSILGYGGSSQVSCMTSTGAGLTTKIVSLVYNGPTADTNCQHVVRGDAIGRNGQLALALGDRATATAAQHVSMTAYCNADEEARQNCIDGGLVMAVSRVKVHGKYVTKIAPVITGASPMAVAKLNSDRGYTTVDYSKIEVAQQAPVEPGRRIPPAPSTQVKTASVDTLNTLPNTLAGQHWLQTNSR